MEPVVGLSRLRITDVPWPDGDPSTTSSRELESQGLPQSLSDPFQSRGSLERKHDFYTEPTTDAINRQKDFFDFHGGSLEHQAIENSLTGFTESSPSAFLKVESTNLPSSGSSSSLFSPQRSNSGSRSRQNSGHSVRNGGATSSRSRGAPHLRLGADLKTEKRAIQAAWGNRGARSFDDTLVRSQSKGARRKGGPSIIFSSSLSVDNNSIYDEREVRALKTRPLKCLIKNLHSGSISYELKSNSKTKKFLKTGSLDTEIDGKTSKKKNIKSFSLDDELDGSTRNNSQNSEAEITFLGSYPRSKRPPPNYKEAVASLSRNSPMKETSFSKGRKSPHLPSYSEHMSQRRKNFVQSNSMPSHCSTDIYKSARKQKSLESDEILSSISKKQGDAKEKRQLFQRMKQQKLYSRDTSPASPANVHVPLYTNPIHVPKFEGKPPKHFAKNSVNCGDSFMIQNVFCPIAKNITSDCNPSVVEPSHHDEILNHQSKISENDTSVSEPIAKPSGRLTNIVPSILLTPDDTDFPDGVEIPAAPIPFNTRRRSSAKSLPDLSGPALDALCPELSLDSKPSKDQSQFSENEKTRSDLSSPLRSVPSQNHGHGQASSFENSDSNQDSVIKHHPPHGTQIACSEDATTPSPVRKCPSEYKFHI